MKPSTQFELVGERKQALYVGIAISIYIGIADGMSIAWVGACRYSKWPI